MFQNDESNNIHICAFDRNEIIPGLKLGQGAFADVKEIRAFVTETHSSSSPSLQTRRFMSENCIAPSTGKARYAIKQIREDLIKTLGAAASTTNDKDKAQSRFWAGVIDLAAESKILQQLEHPVRET